MKTIKYIAIGLAAVGCIAVAEPTLAQSLPTVDVGQRVEATTSLTNNIGFLLQAIIALFGFIVMCIGLYGCYKMNDQNPGNFTWGKAIAGAFVGAAMFFLPLTLGTLGSTLFGTTDRGSVIRVAPGT